MPVEPEPNIVATLTVEASRDREAPILSDSRSGLEVANHPVDLANRLGEFKQWLFLGDQAVGHRQEFLIDLVNDLVEFALRDRRSQLQAILDHVADEVADRSTVSGQAIWRWIFQKLPSLLLDVHVEAVEVLLRNGPLNGCQRFGKACRRTGYTRRRLPGCA